MANEKQQNQNPELITQNQQFSDDKTLDPGQETARRLDVRSDKCFGFPVSSPALTINVSGFGSSFGSDEKVHRQTQELSVMGFEFCRKRLDRF